MSRLKTLIIVIIAVLSFACGDSFSVEGEVIVYENTFESLRDTIDWNNRENIELVDGGSANFGGYFSLFVKSNVSQPATSFNFTSRVKDDKLLFSIDAKLEDSSATAYVKLEATNDNETVSQIITISGGGWKSYKSKENFFVPEDTFFKFSVYTADKDSAGVFLDNLILYRVQ